MGRRYTGKISIGEWRVRKRVWNEEKGEEQDVIYVYERATRYDKALKKTVKVYVKLLGKWDEETQQIVPTRPKKKPRTDADKQDVAASSPGTESAPEAKMVRARRIRVGLTDILNHIGNVSNIKSDLLASFDKADAQKIDTIAQYIVASNDTLPSLEQWQINHETPYNEPISEDTYSDLFKSVGMNEDGIQEFFTRRAKRLDKNATIALDSTTISTYSKNQKEACYGYNKDHDGLKTIKFVVLQSVKDKEPIAFATQRGNIPDVKSLESALAQIRCFSLNKPLVVTDNGYFSQENILYYISKSIKFLTRATNKLVWIREIIDKSMDELQKLSSTCELDNTIKCISRTVMHSFNKTRKRSRGEAKAGDSSTSTHRLYVHVYFNDEQRVADERELTEKIFEIKEKYINNRDVMSEKELEFANRYLIESTRKKNGKPIIYFNDKSFQEAKKYFGIFVLLSNSIKDSETALKNYRLRSEVEYLFDIHKNHHDGRKPRTWYDENLRGRLFVQFVALCYRSYFFNQLQNMKEILGKDDEEVKTKARINLEKDLKKFIQDRSIHQLLQWFDCIERTDVKTARGRYRWSKESTRRDDLFFELLGMTPQGQTAV